MSELVLLIHAASTLLLLGSFWFVALVHYPLIASLHGAAFAHAQKFHYEKTMPLASAFLLIEATTGLALLAFHPASLPRGAFFGGFFLLLLGHYLTWGRCVPCHNKLTKQRESSVLGDLSHAHWYRTGIWSARGVLVLWLLWLLAHKA